MDGLQQIHFKKNLRTLGPNQGPGHTCALTGNPTRDPVAYKTTPNPLSHTGRAALPAF